MPMTNNIAYPRLNQSQMGQNNLQAPTLARTRTHTSVPSPTPAGVCTLFDTPPRNLFFYKNIREVISTRLLGERVYPFLKTLINEYCVSGYNFTGKL